MGDSLSPRWRRTVRVDNARGAAIAEATLRPWRATDGVLLLKAERWLVLTDVYVVPAHRRARLGQHVVQQALIMATLYDRWVLCRPHPHGRGAMSADAMFDFYRKLGFMHFSQQHDWMYHHVSTAAAA